MYESFFGLKGCPFKLSPDPGFFYASSTHAKGLAYLHYGLQQGEGFVVVTGMPGTGKTTLLNILMQDLSPGKFVVVKISNTLLSVNELFRTISRLLNLKTPGHDKVELLEELELYLQQLARTGKRVILLIDEAHNLSPRILEELRLLSNFQYREQHTLQTFLLGQFQLEETLNLPEMLQLRQRVLVSHRLEFISTQETGEYINFRLAKAGWQGAPRFSDKAFQLIHHYTEGIPRQINTLTDRILLFAYLEGTKDITENVVESVITELKDEPASYMHGRIFPDVEVTASDNFPDKRTGNVVAWPTSSLNFHQVETLFPVDRFYPNALQIVHNNISAVAKTRSERVEAILPNTNAEILVDSYDESEIADASIIEESSSDKSLLPHEDNNTDDEINYSYVVYGINDVEKIEGKKKVKKRRYNFYLNLNKTYIAALVAGVCISILLVTTFEDWSVINFESDAIEENSIALNEIKESGIYKSSNSKDGFDEITAKTTNKYSSITAQFQSDDHPVEKEMPDAPENFIVDMQDFPDSGNHKENINANETSESNVSNEDNVNIIGDEKNTKQTDNLTQLFAPQLVEQPTNKTPFVNKLQSPKKLPSENEKLPDLITDIEQELRLAMITPSLSKITPHSNKVSASLKKLEANAEVKVARKNSAIRKSNIKNTNLAKPGVKTTLKKSSLSPAVVSPKIVKKQITKPIDSNQFAKKVSSEIERNNQVRLVALIDRFMLAYQDGDLNGFMSLFSQDVESDDSSGVDKLESEYQKLFNVTDVRRLEIGDFSWEKSDNSKSAVSTVSTVNGESDFQLTIVEKGGSKPVIYAGEISLEVDLNKPDPVITEIYYSYND